jgi:hypothetical protein
MPPRGEVAVRLVRWASRRPPASAATPTDSAGATRPSISSGSDTAGGGAQDADARAVEALLALDYDARSAIHHEPAARRRVAPRPGRRGDGGRPPTPLVIRRIERALYGRVGGSTPRVNREVFRRAIPAKEFTMQLVRVGSMRRRFRGA